MADECQAAALLDSLKAVATQAAVAIFSHEQAGLGRDLADELRALFLPPSPTTMLHLLPELLAAIRVRLDTRDLARLASTCRSLWFNASAPRPRPVEAELRRRAEARGQAFASSLPQGASSWVPYLIKRSRRDALRSQPPLAVGQTHSLFVDADGGLLTCGRDFSPGPGGPAFLVLGHALAPGANFDLIREIGPPTPVPSMQNRRIVSVATGPWHCLALSAQGEVYSWGYGGHGELGHANRDMVIVPCRIEGLSHIKRIAVGPYYTGAAINVAGSLFTWGRRGVDALGYELDPTTEFQLRPKRVDAFSQDRVVGVALGNDFMLVLTDAGDVFSCEHSPEGALGHGSSESEVLPRRIEALAQTGQQFVAVAAGTTHALALTEEGELYGWGQQSANGHGREERRPHPVAGLSGKRVKLVDAGQMTSCAVTEKGELFTWGKGGYSLGHGVNTPQATPKRVEGLGGARVAVVAIGEKHTLAADEDGVVWAFGERQALGLGGLNPAPVQTPTPIPSLRVRALKSP